MRKIRPGRLFWVGTFFVRLFSSSKGKRRVQQRMIEVDELWRLAEVRAETRKEELDRSYEANELLRKEIVKEQTANDTLRGQLAIAIRANEENREAHCADVLRPKTAVRTPNLVQESVEPVVMDREETVPLPKVTVAPGTHVYTASRVPFPDAISPYEKS